MENPEAAGEVLGNEDTGLWTDQLGEFENKTELLLP